MRDESGDWEVVPVDAATTTAVAGTLVDLHGSTYGEVAAVVPFSEILAGGVPSVLAWRGALGWRWLCTSSSPSFAPPSTPSAPASPPNRASWLCLFPTLDLVSFVPNPGDLLGFI